MRTIRSRYFFAIVATTALLGACSNDYPTISVPGTREQFSATLTGANEVPAVATQAAGTATVTIRDTTVVRYEVTVSKIVAVRQAHIHAGAPGQNGPIMVDLFVVTTPTAAIENGVLRQGDITRRSTFRAPFTFDSLLTRVRAGSAYVNVHTSANPGGELRGQITPTAPAAAR